MPDRILRAGILTSESVNTLSWPAEVFYRRLMSVVDDFGRYDGRPAVLRAALFPLRLDNVSEPDVAKWIRETEEAALVRGYVVSDRQYIEVQKFNQRLRAKTSKWPPPNGSPRGHLTADDSRCGHSSDSDSDFVSGSEGNGGPGERGIEAPPFEAFKALLNPLYSRPADDRWGYAEEQAMVMIVARPNWRQEFDTIKAFRSDAYFPQSLPSLLEKWGSVLDRARNPNHANRTEKANVRNVGIATDPTEQGRKVAAYVARQQANKKPV